MKILNFKKFSLLETIQGSPESHVDSLLKQIKKKVDSFFVKESQAKRIEKIGDVITRKKEKEDLNFQDLGVELQSSELSRYSKVYDSVKFKFSDNEALYDLTITIDLKDAVPKDEDKDFDIEDIKNCNIKFKKYTIDNFDLVGEITKTIKVKEITQDLLVSLKLEIDEKFGEEGDENDFEIETEE